MPAERHHLFVSYASINNDPMPGVKDGWVTELVRGVRRILENQLGRRDNLDLWMDYELHGNDTITPTIEDALLHSETILLILSPAYLASDWCRKELCNFIAQHDIESGRVFMVEMEPIEKPEALQDLKGFRFFEQGQDGQFSMLGWPAPDPKQLAYYEKIDDLGRSIAKKILQIEADRYTQPILQPEHIVLLAPVTDDLFKARDQIRRYLEQQNILVLPENGTYPRDKLETRLLADLVRADLYVQLLSIDSGMGTPVFQHECAKKGDKPLLLWHPEGLDAGAVIDQTHATLLHDDQLIVSDMVELQLLIQKKLNPPTKPNMDKNREILLFINHAPEDHVNLQPLIEELKKRKIGYSRTLSSDEAVSPAALRQDLEQNLLGCDALVMLFYDAPVTWIREQLLFWRRTAIKRDKPFLGVGVCKEPDANDLGMYPPGVKLVECVDRCPSQCLDNLPFLKRVML